MGNITPMLAKIHPVVEALEYEGDRSSQNEEFVHMVCKSNVQNAMQQVRARSPILQEMKTEGAIKMVGAVYDMDNGKVAFLDKKAE
jgi:carbonic anhydrase